MRKRRKIRKRRKRWKRKKEGKSRDSTARKRSRKGVVEVREKSALPHHLSRGGGGSQRNE